MFRALHRIWRMRIRAATAALAVVALLAAASSYPLELDHRVPNAQPAAVSITDIDGDGGVHVQHASNTECHIGHSCTPALIPCDPQHNLERFDSSPVLPHVPDCYDLRVKYRPFHPPQILSQV